MFCVLRHVCALVSICDATTHTCLPLIGCAAVSSSWASSSGLHAFYDSVYPVRNWSDLVGGVCIGLKQPILGETSVGSILALTLVEDPHLLCFEHVSFQPHTCFSSPCFGVARICLSLLCVCGALRCVSSSPLFFVLRFSPLGIFSYTWGFAHLAHLFSFAFLAPLLSLHVLRCILPRR